MQLQVLPCFVLKAVSCQGCIQAYLPSACSLWATCMLCMADWRASVHVLHSVP